MATFYWKGATSTGATGQNWGFTANWLNASFAGATQFPRGGDTVIFGASAISSCLVGGLSGGLWIGYTAGDANSATDITVQVTTGYGVTHPNNLTQLGYSFGSVTGGLQLKVSNLHVATTANPAEISIKNYPVSTYSIAHVDGPTATFYASGTWENIVVRRGSLETQDLTSDLISIEGVRGTTPYYDTTEGYGVNKVTIGGNTDVNAVVASVKATKEQMTMNVIAKTPIVNAMGVTAEGYTYTSVAQVIRPAGMEREYNRINRTLRYKRS